MPITAKPFSYDEQIQNISFSGRPAFFNAKDLEKKGDIVKNALVNAIDYLGVKSTAVVTVTNVVDTGSSGTVIPDITGWNTNDSYKTMTPPSGDYRERTLSFDYSISAGYVYTKGVRFKVTATTGSFSKEYAWKEGTPPLAAYVVLSSELITKNFGDGKPNSNTLCGIQSTEYPTLVPSCSIQQYDTPTISCVSLPSSVSNFVCILYTVLPSESGGTVVYTTFRNSEDIDGIEVATDTYVPGILYANYSLLEKLNAFEYEPVGLVYRGAIGSSQDLNNYKTMGIWVINYLSKPSNVPSDTILGASSTPDSSFYLEVRYFGDSTKVAQFIGNRKGILAKRYFGSGGWSSWVSYWSSQTATLLGSDACSIVSPYAMQNHGAWVTATLVNAWTGFFKYRKLTNGLIEVKFHLDGTSATNISVTGVDSGYFPLEEIIRPAVGDASIRTAKISISTLGQVGASGYNGADAVSYDGVFDGGFIYSK